VPSEYPLVRRAVSGTSLVLYWSSSSDVRTRAERREDADGLRLRWDESASISSMAAKSGEMGRDGVCARD